MADAPLVLTPIEATDVPGLTAMMTASFDDSARRHAGHERGGPPGYDSEDFLYEWAVGKPFAWKASDRDQVVGAVLVFPGEDGHHYVGRLFVDPGAQRRGYGGRIWDQVYARFPEALSWSLDTPERDTSNHAFYEVRCGFVLADRVEADHGLSRIYRRPGLAAREAPAEG